MPLAFLQGGREGSHEVAGNSYVFPENSQMASTGVICTSTYHTKWLNPWANSPASRVAIYSRLAACALEMEPFKDHPSTRGRLTGLRNKPQQKQLE